MSKKRIGNKQKGVIGLAIMAVLSAGVIFGSEPIYKVIDNYVSNLNSAKSENLKDGTYTVEKVIDGSKEIMNMTVTGGAITDVTWDVIDKDGVKKSQLSAEGKYVMTEDGPKWHEQTEAMAAYFIKNQSVDKLNLNEEGKTDAVAGVSINISSFVDLAKDCLLKASGKVASFKDGDYTVEKVNEEDKEILTMSVKNGFITAVSWDVIDKDGIKKSQLSVEGNYVMTDNGPKWHEQAEALAAYLIENQSVDQLVLNEEGKTDTIASVSINISSFVELAKEGLAKASNNNSSLKDGIYEAEATFEGNTDTATMEVKDGAIVALSWDVIDKDGTKKSQLSVDGNYAMTENGPKWHEQAEALAAFVLEEQSLNSLTTNEEGKTDAITSVSINIQGFIGVVEDCIKQASK